MLTAKDKRLCALYLLFALGALIATWSNNLEFFALPDHGGGLMGFIRMANANPAARSLSNDLLFMCFSAFTLMVVEARKHGVRHVWLYILLSLCIAVSVMFPLFLLARQLKIAEERGRQT